MKSRAEELITLIHHSVFRLREELNRKNFVKSFSTCDAACLNFIRAAGQIEKLVRDFPELKQPDFLHSLAEFKTSLLQAVPDETPINLKNRLQSFVDEINRFTAIASEKLGHKAGTTTSKNLSGTGHPAMELIVLGVSSSNHAQCRRTLDQTKIALKTPFAYELIPGETIDVVPAKIWTYSGRTNVSGKIAGKSFDVQALQLTPLKLHEYGTWNPQDHEWAGDEYDLSQSDWAKEIIAAGIRPVFEMEAFIPGQDLDDIDSDPIYEAVELFHSGYERAALSSLNKMLEQDLRCIDAHAHLGSFTFDTDPKMALKHYEVGKAIAELSQDPQILGVLPWGLIDNRPYLRCLHGYGLCLWRLERFDEAAAAFKKLLWLNPNDNQGARFLYPEAKAHKPWRRM